MTARHKIVFATNNPNKLREIREIVGDRYEIVSLGEIGCEEDLPETADTIEGNALMKARYVSDKYHVDCFADDTGLEVEALAGAPGVHTARYASTEHCDSDANIDLLLKNLEGVENRRARFVTSIALIEGGCATVFEGVCPGRILQNRQGDSGFGYDPVFAPEGGDLSFAQMDHAAKNAVSHRGCATKQLVEYLNNQSSKH